MIEKRVVIKVAQDGKCEIDAQGFPDAGCKVATQSIVDALGRGVIAERDKPEASVTQRGDVRGRVTG